MSGSSCIFICWIRVRTSVQCSLQWTYIYSRHFSTCLFKCGCCPFYPRRFSSFLVLLDVPQSHGRWLLRYIVVLWVSNAVVQHRTVIHWWKTYISFHMIYGKTVNEPEGSTFLCCSAANCNAADIKKQLTTSWTYCDQSGRNFNSGGGNAW